VTQNTYHSPRVWTYLGGYSSCLEGDRAVAGSTNAISPSWHAFIYIQGLYTCTRLSLPQHPSMTRLSESPPAYSELDALIANLTTLDLAASTGNPRPPCSPRTPPPNRPVDSPQPTPQTPRRPATSVYEFESPTRSGRTTQWRVSTHLFMRSLLTIWMTQVRGLLLLTRCAERTCQSCRQNALGAQGGP
jgi:hypothetical protein